ncbi:hypothetical protein Dimus_009324 [Dionaea muscipula]
MPLPRDIPAYVSLLESCCAARNLHKIQQLHSQAIKMGISHNDFIRAKLVSCYASCAQMADASYIFSLSNRQSTFLYNTLICGYAFVKDYNRSLATFRSMLASHKPIDRNTLPTVSRSVSGFLLRPGPRVHAFVLVNGLGFDVGHCNGLVTMYAECGDLGSARTVFGENAREKLGFLVCHDGWMREPWGVRGGFRIVLQDGGFGHFAGWDNLYHTPSSRVLVEGQPEEAKELIETMEMESDDVLWRAFWGSCRIHGVVDITIGEDV